MSEAESMTTENAQIVADVQSDMHAHEERNRLEIKRALVRQGATDANLQQRYEQLIAQAEKGLSCGMWPFRRTCHRTDCILHNFCAAETD